MEALRRVVACIFGLTALYFGGLAVDLLGNNLFEWQVDKISIEWSTTALFAAWCGGLFFEYAMAGESGSLMLAARVLR
jgi:hypothetical protein